MKNKDTRVMVTQTILKNALIEILETKRIDAVTVTELCDRAGINRGTFYLHYGTPFDALKEIEDEQVKNILNQIQNYDTQNGKVMIPHAFFKCLENQKRVWRIIIGPNGNPRFFDSLTKSLKERMLLEWQKDNPDCDVSNLKFTYDFVMAGCTSIIMNWLESNCPEPCEIIATKIGFLSEYCLKATPEISHVIEKALNIGIKP